MFASIGDKEAIERDLRDIIEGRIEYDRATEILKGLRAQKAIRVAK